MYLICTKTLFLIPIKINAPKSVILETWPISSCPTFRSSNDLIPSFIINPSFSSRISFPGFKRESIIKVKSYLLILSSFSNKSKLAFFKISLFILFKSIFKYLTNLLALL